MSFSKSLESIEDTFLIGKLKILNQTLNKRMLQKKNLSNGSEQLTNVDIEVHELSSEKLPMLSLGPDK